jgi:hypothetical protein
MPDETGPGAGGAGTRRAISSISADGAQIAEYHRAAQAEIVATDWRPVTPPRNTLIGWVSFRLPSGAAFRDVSVHEQGDRRWIGLPSCPQIDQDGRCRTNPATGKRLYKPCVEIPDPTSRDQFQRQALDAVDRMLGAGLRSAGGPP